MPLTSSVMRQSISNFRLYCCSKKIQILRKKVKLLLEQLQVCIFAEIVFGVRFTLKHQLMFGKLQMSCFSQQVLFRIVISFSVQKAVAQGYR